MKEKEVRYIKYGRERERDDGGGSLSLSGGREGGGGGKKHLVWPLSFFFVFHLLEKKMLNFSFLLIFEERKNIERIFEKFKFAEECL